MTHDAPSQTATPCDSTPADPFLRITVDEGKYTVTHDAGRVCILRYGEPWLGPYFPGVNAVLALAAEIEQLRARVRELETPPVACAGTPR